MQQGDETQAQSQLPLMQSQSSSSSSRLSFRPTFLRSSEDSMVCSQREEILDTHELAEEHKAGCNSQSQTVISSSSSSRNNDVAALFGSPAMHDSSRSVQSISASYSPIKPPKGGRHSSRRDSLNSLTGVLRKVLSNVKSDLIWMMNIGKIHDKRSMQGE